MNVLNEVGLEQNFSLKDINICKQALDAKQKTLDSFACSEKENTEETIVQNNENSESSNTVSRSCSVTPGEEADELFELTDVNFGDWDDMEW